MKLPKVSFPRSRQPDLIRVAGAEVFMERATRLMDGPREVAGLVESSLTGEDVRAGRDHVDSVRRHWDDTLRNVEEDRVLHELRRRVQRLEQVHELVEREKALSASVLDDPKRIAIVAPGDVADDGAQGEVR